LDRPASAALNVQCALPAATPRLPKLRRVCHYCSAGLIHRPVAVTVAFEGTTRWLNNSRFTSISVDTKRPLNELIDECDVVVSSTGSPTTWAEVIVLKNQWFYSRKLPWNVMPSHTSAILKERYIGVNQKILFIRL
jgi:hypothetical protein